SDNNTPSLILKTENTADFGNIFKTRSTVSEVFDFMISDLNIAIENISNTKYVGRFNRSAAHGLLSRIYLDMNEWDKVEEHATAAIEGFSLEARPIDGFNHTDLSFSQEVIFETQNSIGHNWTGERHYSYISENSPSWISHWNWIDLQSMGRSIAGGDDYSVEGTIYRTYPISYSILRKIGWMEASSATVTDEAENDLRYQQLFHWSPGNTDYRMEFVTLMERPELPFMWVFKAARSANDDSFDGNLLGEQYYNLEHAQNGTGLYDGRAHLPLIRVSEMYLSRAIARLRQGKDGEALGDLNLVKQVRWDNNAGPFIPYGGGGQQLEEEIERERIKELLGEGDRLFYLKAMQYDIPVGDAERRTDISVPVVSFPYEELFWELPPVETNANPNVD
ncbi:MAG: RagB/SusD family nutrient uptake outer membrane protein, partial [Ekhidna sp.]|nr:RagB/SusD family nutrient uptake outer membrane protein [Ekhidna sp.]